MFAIRIGDLRAEGGEAEDIAGEFGVLGIGVCSWGVAQHSMAEQLAQNILASDEGDELLVSLLALLKEQVALLEQVVQREGLSVEDAVHLGLGVIGMKIPH